METILNNLKDIVPFFLGSWLIFLVFSIWKPQRFRNCIFLMFSLLMTDMFICCLFGDKMSVAFLCSMVIVIIAILFVPFLLIWNGMIMMKKESRSLGNILSLILGVIIGVGEVAVFLRALEINFFGTGKINVWFFFIGTSIFYISCWILAFVLYVFVIQFMPHRMNFDYVIIHDCGLLGGERISKLLSNRIDKAIQIYNKCKKKPIIIPSGGKGSDESLSEAEAMRNYLLEKGIPDDHIIMEDKSATTMENIEFSARIVNERDGQKKTALVSSNYHVYRCVLYASKQKFKCTGIGARVAWYFWPSATLREFVAIFSKPPYIVWIIIGYVIFTLIPTLWYLK